MSDLKIEFTPNQLIWINSFNKEINNDEEILWGSFAYKRDKTLPKNVFQFYEFPLIDYKHLEYLGWKKSKSHKNTLEKGFYWIHIYKDKDLMKIGEDKGLWDDGIIYEGKIPTQIQFLELLKLLKID